MEKLFTIQVSEQETGSCVENVLRKQFTKAQIRSMKFRENGICVNGIRARVTQMLCAGDVLTLRLEDGAAASERLVSVRYPLEILREDDDVLCVWKPAGMVVHPAHGHYRDTLVNYLHHYFREKGETVQMRGIGRLDADTSGVMVFAKNKVAAQRLWRQRREGIFQKEYLALCEGEFPREAYCREQKLEAAVAPAPGEKNKMCVNMQGKTAVTYYRALKTNADGQTLVLLRLETGRTHQIRVHMAHLGHPLVGDPVYGNGTAQTHAQLCAWKVRFAQPFTGEPIEAAGNRTQIQKFI